MKNQLYPFIFISHNMLTIMSLEKFGLSDNLFEENITEFRRRRKYVPVGRRVCAGGGHYRDSKTGKQYYDPQWTRRNC